MQTATFTLPSRNTGISCGIYAHVLHPTPESLTASLMRRLPRPRNHSSRSELALPLECLLKSVSPASHTPRPDHVMRSLGFEKTNMRKTEIASKQTKSSRSKRAATDKIRLTRARHICTLNVTFRTIHQFATPRPVDPRTRQRSRRYQHLRQYS